MRKSLLAFRKRLKYSILHPLYLLVTGHRLLREPCVVARSSNIIPRFTASEFWVVMSSVCELRIIYFLLYTGIACRRNCAVRVVSVYTLISKLVPHPQLLVASGLSVILNCDPISSIVKSTLLPLRRSSDGWSRMILAPFRSACCPSSGV